jgi:hypothetical protein
VLAGNPANGMFRPFGDVTGDATVNGLDLAAFGNAFATAKGSPAYRALLDANGDGAINGLELQPSAPSTQARAARPPTSDPSDRSPLCSRGSFREYSGCSWLLSDPLL